MSEQTVYGAVADSESAFQAAHQGTHPSPAQVEGRRPQVGHVDGLRLLHRHASSTTAEIPVLLVGDSAANVVYGYDTTVPVTIDELIPLVRGVVRGAPHALVVADLPFGSYEAGPAQALATATRFLKETGAHAVKLEGGERVADQIAALTPPASP